jgi:small subunit ribosomal protein S13
MARIAGIELNDKDRVIYALTRIKGVGWSRSEEILRSLKMETSTRVSDLSSDDLSAITQKLENYVTEGDLVREVREHVQRLKNINSYRGLRHSRNLPARGQRTRSNARTKRGARKTIGAFKKDELQKQAPTS